MLVLKDGCGACTIRNYLLPSHSRTPHKKYIRFRVLDICYIGLFLQVVRSDGTGWMMASNC
jgi:hypothetical protein